MFSYTIQIQDLFLFIYIFIYLFFVENSLICFCFQLISDQYKHSNSTCNFKFRNAMRIPSGMFTGTCSCRYSSTFKYFVCIIVFKFMIYLSNTRKLQLLPTSMYVLLHCCQYSLPSYFFCTTVLIF